MLVNCSYFKHSFYVISILHMLAFFLNRLETNAARTRIDSGVVQTLGILLKSVYTFFERISLMSSAYRERLGAGSDFLHPSSGNS